MGCLFVLPPWQSYHFLMCKAPTTPKQQLCHQENGAKGIFSTPAAPDSHEIYKAISFLKTYPTYLCRTQVLVEDTHIRRFPIVLCSGYLYLIVELTCQSLGCLVWILGNGWDHKSLQPTRPTTGGFLMSPVAPATGILSWPASRSSEKKTRLWSNVGVWHLFFWWTLDIH